jgi:hypothetical protein
MAISSGQPARGGHRGETRLRGGRDPRHADAPHVRVPAPRSRRRIQEKKSKSYRGPRAGSSSPRTCLHRMAEAEAGCDVTRTGAQLLAAESSLRALSGDIRRRCLAFGHFDPRRPRRRRRGDRRKGAARRLVPNGVPAARVVPRAQRRGRGRDGRRRGPLPQTTPDLADEEVMGRAWR